MIDYYEPKLDLTLMGCGFLGNYHLGAIYLLSQIWPHKPFNRICGASCGGLMGALIVAGLKMDCVLMNAMDIIRQLRGFIRSPMQINSHPSVADLVELKLDTLLPKNAHELCTGRLGVSLTKIWSFENRFVSKFESRRHLIDAVCAGCFIPFWSGSVKGPKVNGEHFIDGAYSSNNPKFEADETEQSGRRKFKLVGLTRRQVELSPFAGHVEVTPKDKTYLFKARAFGQIYLANWNNFLRSSHAMLPFSLDTYRTYLIAGHKDMKEYLFRNNMIKCRNCYSRQVEMFKNQSIECDATDDNSGDDEAVVEHQQKYDACLHCLKLLERVDNLRVSEEMLQMCNE